MSFIRLWGKAFEERGFTVTYCEDFGYEWYHFAEIRGKDISGAIFDPRHPDLDYAASLRADNIWNFDGRYWTCPVKIKLYSRNPAKFNWDRALIALAQLADHGKQSTGFGRGDLFLWED